MQLEAIHAQKPLHAVLITGDVTDAGISSEWGEFLEAAGNHPRLAKRMLMLPGNHDLNIVDRANPARLDLPTKSEPALATGSNPFGYECDPGPPSQSGRP